VSVTYNAAVGAIGPSHAATSIASPAFVPAANDTEFFIGFDGTSGTASLSDTTSVGAMTALTMNQSTTPVPNFNDGSSDTWALAYQANLTAVSQTVTVSESGSGDSIRSLGFCFSGAGVPNTALATAVDTGPGTGAGALVGQAAVVPVGSVMIGVVFDQQGGASTITANNGGAPAAFASGSGFTGGTGTWAAFMYAGTGASFTPNWTVSVGTDPFTIVQVILPLGLVPNKVIENAQVNALLVN
jgi:hypothetical protein